MYTEKKNKSKPYTVALLHCYICGITPTPHTPGSFKALQSLIHYCLIKHLNLALNKVVWSVSKKNILINEVFFFFF